MPSKASDLQSFLSHLENTNEVVRVSDPVRIDQDIAQLADKASKLPAPNLPSQRTQDIDPLRAGLGGPAYIIEKPQLPGGSIADIPVAINTFGSYTRIERALNCTPDSNRPGGLEALADIMGELTKPELPQSLGDAINKAKQFAPLLKIGPKRKKGRGLSQQVVRTGDDIDLTKLPIIKCWPLDGNFEDVGYPAGINDHVQGIDHSADFLRGRYITLGGIHTIHADDRDQEKPQSHNIGMYRVQVLGKNRAAMHWHIHHDGAAHWRSWKKLGKPMPVAIALGGEPCLPYAATAPLPPGISELLMAGFLNGSGIELARGITVPLWVPANAEIIIEGFVRTDAGEIGWDPREDSPNHTTEPLGDGAVFEGPFGDHTGFYSMPDRYPILEITAITTREKPVYPTTVVGLPPQEDYFLGKATERLFLPLLKVIVPDVLDYDLPMFGAFHNCAFLQIKKHYPMQARRLMHAIWGAGQMAWTKNLFIVDETVDVHDHRAVLKAAAQHCLPERDIEQTRGPLDILDHAAPYLGTGTKLGFDCTPKWAGESVETQPHTKPTNFTKAQAAGQPPTMAALFKEDHRVVDAVEPEHLPGWIFLKIPKRTAGEGKRLLVDVLSGLGSIDSGLNFILVVDDTVDMHNPEEVLFHWCANCDASRDAVWGVGTVGFDCTPKFQGDDALGEPVRPWPPIIQRADQLAKQAV